MPVGNARRASQVDAPTLGKARGAAREQGDPLSPPGRPEGATAAPPARFPSRSDAREGIDPLWSWIRLLTADGTEGGRARKLTAENAWIAEIGCASGAPS